MTKRMLIDASQPEETRVVVINDQQQLEDFDFESSTKKQLKGNIYLAKVTRVEPSLQAAFVDYGGQRHGFLAFSEIHPDYYQVPQADRKLLDEVRRLDGEADGEADGDEHGDGDGGVDPDEEASEVFAEQARRRSRLLRSYKIQEVIKRRQIILVQVVKEERGNKGAALTTYLSLAGRYCVLMPNTGRGGGISRKIANPGDRSRLKAIARSLDVPEGMGLIIRTAGQERNKLEIRRDYDYLLRLWNDIRELTLQSIAPCTIHEEGALVKRAVRDLYGSDIEEILVEGEEGYRSSRKVMSMLMPSRARRIKLYKEELPLFLRYAVEDQLDALHSPVVQLRSGGSIVIHTTEALTAIDVNSGRATRERNIEETALKTNLEAADAVARQLRLRDLAGLIVVDFIDMAESRNQKAVERRLRDALKSDRARVQFGRISAFGLLELSRQRLRPSLQELSTQPCPACGGTGVVRSVGSAALRALRGVELEGIKSTTAALRLTLPEGVALYVLNQKRDRLVGLEQRYSLAVDVQIDHHMTGDQLLLEPTEQRGAAEVQPAEAAEAAEPAEQRGAPEARATEEDAGARKRRRRRRRRRKGGEAEVEQAGEPMAASQPAEQPVVPAGAFEQPAWQAEPAAVAERSPEFEPLEPQPISAEAGNGEVRDEPEVAEVLEKRPRRRRRRTRAEVAAEAAGEPTEPSAGPGVWPEPAAVPDVIEVRAPNGADGDDLPVLEPAPLPSPESVPEQVSAAAADEVDEAAEPEPARRPEVPTAAVVDQGPEGAPRKGWWSRFVRKDD
jgi:ribonuclease E